MITFVGAGPGAEDLITVRGQRLLKEADIVIYAGSLVNPGLLKLCKEKCEIYNSAKMTLEEVLEVMVKGHGDGKEIVRLHTGDPSLYGAIREQMEKDGTSHVWLSMEHIDKETILNHFPNIYQRCLEEGYDVTKEYIPVVPAQHYFMGGVWVDSDSKTSMEHLYAVGETSCNGVHGANRLASNSLLESLVFAKRAANKISGTENEVKVRELA